MRNGAALNDASNSVVNGDAELPLRENPLEPVLAPWDANRSQAICSLICLWTALCASNLMENTFTLFQPSLTMYLGTQEDVSDCAYTVLLIVDAVAGPLFARLRQRCGIQFMFIVAAFLSSITTAGLATLESVPMLMLCYCFGGMISASMFSTCQMAAVELMPVNKQGLASGLMSLNIAGAAILSVPIKWCIDEHGFHMAFLMQGCIASAFLFACWLAIPRTESSRGNDSSAESDLNAGRDGNTTKSCSLIFKLYVVYATAAITFDLLESQLQQILNATVPKTGVAQIGVTVCLVVNTIARMFWSAAALRWSAILCMATSLLFVVAALNTWGFTADSPSAALSCAASSLFGSTGFWPLMPVILARLFPRSSGTMIYAILNTANLFAAVLGGPVAGWLSQKFGWRVVLHVSSVVPAFGFVALVLPSLSR